MGKHRYINLPGADFTVRVGSDTKKWYSRRGGENFGEAAGDLTLMTPGGVITRIWYRGVTLTFNSRGGSFADWRAAHGADDNVMLSTPYGPVSFTPAHQSSVGGGYLIFRCTPAQQTILNRVGTGDEIMVNIE